MTDEQGKPTGEEREEEWVFNPFASLLADAIVFDELAHGAGDVVNANRFTRSAVLNAALAIECAAHACTTRLPNISRQLVNKLDAMTTVEKYDFLHWIARRAPLPRGDTPVQQMVELIGLRNDLVHAKVVRQRVKLRATTPMVHQMMVNPTTFPMLKIPGDTKDWKPEHGRRVSVVTKPEGVLIENDEGRRSERSVIRVGLTEDRFDDAAIDAQIAA